VNGSQPEPEWGDLDGLDGVEFWEDDAPGVEEFDFADAVGNAVASGELPLPQTREQLEDWNRGLEQLSTLVQEHSPGFQQLVAEGRDVLAKDLDAAARKLGGTIADRDAAARDAEELFVAATAAGVPEQEAVQEAIRLAARSAAGRNVDPYDLATERFVLKHGGRHRGFSPERRRR
jgi:hypothetical protein